MNSKITQSTYSAMQDGKPYSVYKKSILGQVYVQAINPFNGEPEGILLKGNHLANDENCFIQLWSVKEHEFFKRTNKLHIQKGYLIPVEVPKYVKTVDTYTGIDYSQYTDEEIDSVLNSPFLSLRAHLNKSDSEPYALRILDRARVLEKSNKIVAAIQSRIEEIQLSTYGEE